MVRGENSGSAPMGASSGITMQPSAAENQYRLGSDSRQLGRIE